MNSVASLLPCITLYLFSRRLFSLLSYGIFIDVNVNVTVKKLLLTILTLLTPLLSFAQIATHDFGDAPVSYGSADHHIDGTARYLGSKPDAELAQQYSAEADGDDLTGSDDEDGVTFPDMIQGTTVTIRVIIVGSARLNAWIDWNSDGDFADSGERVASNVSISSSRTYNLSVKIPVDAMASKPTFARFRYGPSLSGSTGSATYGEVEDYMIKIICAYVAQPKVSNITQPDCQSSTGSVLIDGLPSTGTWILTRLPDGETTEGTGTHITIDGLVPGTWSYTVTNASGCTSGPSENIVILPAPATPAAPLIDTIIQPTCSVATGQVLLSGLPVPGTWTLTRYPDLIIITGTGSGTTVTGLPAGTFYFTVANSDGCTSPASSNAVVKSPPVVPGPPTVGTITQPTCQVITGSVTLSDLPATGTWVLTRSPGGTTSTGTGTSTIITGLDPGTWSYTVTNESGCTSIPSADIVILAGLAVPPAPEIDTIIQPTCIVSTGSVILTGLPASGSWTLTRYPDVTTFSGTGISTTIIGFNPGIYQFTVTNSAGCTSSASSDIIINQQPATPAAPVPGTITHPTCQVPGGTVILSGLPSTGVWTLVRLPGSITSTGTGTSTTVSGLEPGMYNFYVINAAGCSSTVSSNVVINPRPGPVPSVNITNPAPVCSPATVDLTNPGITEGSTEGLTYSYWLDIIASIPYNTPAQATEGTYYIKGTTVSGCSDIKPVTVTVLQQPVADAGPDQVLEYLFTTTMDADIPAENLTGSWSFTSGSGHFADPNNAKTTVSDLAIGENILAWAVDNGVCPPSLDYVIVIVVDFVIPTLITPNYDNLNDFFFLGGLESLGKTRLTIIDRRGILVFENKEYDNRWDGVDYNGNPLPDDTYFFILKPENRKGITGYIVVRR